MRKPLSSRGRLEFIPPIEPKLVPKPPEGEHWIHEIKLDGYRTQIVVNSPDDIRVFTKPGADWTSKYTGLVEAARELEVKNAIFEGEAVVTNEAGLPDFAALQKAVQRPLRHDPRRLRHHACRRP
ncbi:hypothetical protein [Mesorhizobium sp. M0643]|uniref:ATP-dependent DNA ligase n=1 Tax=Mesorhizobium sp. M0643 TaxID=2956978 RepID=UPI00333624EE